MDVSQLPAPSSASAPAGGAGQAAEPSDGELARRIAAGDRQAAAMLIDRHQAAVRWFLRRVTGREDLADDLAQDTFLRVLRHAGRYDARYPMRTWLFTIARRLSINQARARRERFMTHESETMADKRAGPAEAAVAADERDIVRRRVHAALTQLSEPQRAALLLVHQQGLQVEEVAAAMGLPVGTVKSHLHRGRESLRRILRSAN
jgi:RNA polymerase sigma-70 factor (ECF subfamily)